MGSNQTIRGRDIETIISKPVFIMQTTAHNDISSSNPIRIENRSIPDDTLTRSIQINDYRRQRGWYTSCITCHSYLSSSHEPVSKREKKREKGRKKPSFSHLSPHLQALRKPESKKTCESGGKLSRFSLCRPNNENSFTDEASVGCDVQSLLSTFVVLTLPLRSHCPIL